MSTKTMMTMAILTKSSKYSPLDFLLLLPLSFIHSSFNHHFCILCTFWFEHFTLFFHLIRCHHFSTSIISNLCLCEDKMLVRCSFHWMLCSLFFVIYCFNSPLFQSSWLLIVHSPYCGNHGRSNEIVRHCKNAEEFSTEKMKKKKKNAMRKRRLLFISRMNHFMKKKWKRKRKYNNLFTATKSRNSSNSKPHKWNANWQTWKYELRRRIRKNRMSTEKEESAKEINGLWGLAIFKCPWLSHLNAISLQLLLLFVLLIVRILSMHTLYPVSLSSFYFSWNFNFILLIYISVNWSTCGSSVSEIRSTIYMFWVPFVVKGKEIFEQ